MSFDELITFLQGHRGKTVEVALGRRGGEDFGGIAGFSGRIGALSRSSRPGPERWTLRLASDAVLPEPGCLHLRRDRFDSCEVTAEPSSVPEERGGESGTVWSLQIREQDWQAELLFYV